MLARIGGSAWTVQHHQLRQHLSFAAIYLVAAGFLLVMVGVMRFFPPTFGASALLLVVLVAVAAVRPALTLGAAIALTLVGDNRAMPWWPVAKNMSAGESILYAADALTIKPLDLLLLAVALILLLNRRLSPNAPRLQVGELSKPVALFSATVVLGVAWGYANGGDFRIATFEFIPLLYIGLIYFLASTVFTTPGHYRVLAVAIVLALFVEAVHTWFRLPTIRALIPSDASPVEHTATLHMNLVFLLLLSMTWFGRRSRFLRCGLIAALVPITIVYLDAQRRSAIVALVVGLIVFMGILFLRERKKFLVVGPLLGVVLVVYLAAFWNVQGNAGFPAQAIKTVVAPEDSSESDQSSDLYRLLENLNLNATVRANPVLGQGFGRPFLQPYQLPELTASFEFADYIPHNTIYWIWIRTGLLGFVGFLYLAGRGVGLGMEAVKQLTSSTDTAVLAIFVAYLPMSVVVMFVEISSDPGTMVLFGLSLAAASTASRWVEEEKQAKAENEAAGEAEDTGAMAGPKGALCRR